MQTVGGQDYTVSEKHAYALESIYSDGAGNQIAVLYDPALGSSIEVPLSCFKTFFYRFQTQ
jgi:hypothetical protein